MIELANIPERIASRIVHHEETGCMLWTGATNRDGYGIVKFNGTCSLVHRVVYEAAYGCAIAPGAVLDHLKDERGPCRHRHCCNPAHLEPVTAAENSRRVLTANGQKTHCMRGHDLSVHGEAKTYGDGYTRRYCRACRQLKNLARRKTC